MNNIKWKDIIGYEGLYQISNQGLVKSLKRIEFINGWSRRRSKRILVSKLDRDGYLRVVLCKNGKIRTFFIHRLVANHFIKKPNEDFKLQINHKDGIKTNNSITNLEWCSQSHNMLHAYKIGLIDIQKNQGVNNWNSKLDENGVKLIRSLCEDGISQREIAKQFNISQRAVSFINTRKNWGWLE